LTERGSGADRGTRTDRGTGIRPTRRGWVLLSGALVSLAAGLLFGIGELTDLAVAGTVLVVGAAVWVRGRRWEVRTERMVRPARVPAGSTVTVDLSLSNLGSRATPVLELSDGMDAIRASFPVAPLAPGEVLRGGYDLPPLPRGRYRVGPLELSLSDPLGLVRRTRDGVGASLLSVHPPVPLLDHGPEGRGHGGRLRHGDASSADGAEFASLRAWRDGDDLRQVHWVSTARLDRLMVRQEDATAIRRCTVAIDVRSTVWAAGRFEDMLAAAAGLLDAARRRGGEVRLVSSGGTDSGFGGSASHGEDLLDMLAGVHPGPVVPDVPLARLLPVAGTRAGTWVVLSSSRADGTDLAGLRLLAPPSALVAVVFDVGGDPPGGTPFPGRLIHVGPEADFAGAWARRDTRSATGPATGSAAGSAR
jgi:uncharacterized protein (DUF58 family)